MLVEPVIENSGVIALAVFRRQGPAAWTAAQFAMEASSRE